MAEQYEKDIEEGLLSGQRKTLPNSSYGLKRILKSALPVVALIGLAVLFLPRRQRPQPQSGFPDGFRPDWAQYTPYIPQASYSRAEGCVITQVNILQRHGARYPTSGAAKRIVAALAKLIAVQRTADVKFKFLETFKYDLGVNDLVAFGADQSFEAGKETFRRYSHLLTSQTLPFVRSSSAERVVLSATNWTAGFAFGSDHVYRPQLSVILSEAANDTLDDKMCPSAGSADQQTAAWLATYAPPITASLNSAAPGANLTDTDTAALISLCPFDTYAKGAMSPFCDIFEAEEGAFAGFSYMGDLDKYYGTGYGQALGAVQGVGYVNELLARLTRTPVRDNTQTNRTLDASPETFPLNRTIYADFSHDNEMIAIFAAMGLFKQPAIEPLALNKPDAGRIWRVGEMVPFSGRMVVERLECQRDLGDGENGMAVRILVNDRIQPLEFCDAAGDGICSLSAFVESQAYSRNDGEGDWEQCFV